jgi:hypothetical protein
MAKMMAVALPVMAIAGAAFTGGTSLGLLGGDASLMASADVAAGASTAAEAAAADATASFGSGTLASLTPSLSTAAMGLQAGGTIVSALGNRNAGIASQNEADYEAAQLRQNAGQEQASAEQKMQQQNRQTDYVLSNAQAAAAAGGGSATDPTVVNNLSTIAGEGRYRALTDMYQGNAAAQALENKATATQYGGQLTKQADTTKMYSTILGGASSMFNRYANTDKNNTNNDGYASFLLQGS